MTPEELLERRTRALATPAAILERAVLPQLLLRVSGETYALATDSVRAVAELRKVTPLPHTPQRVLGLTARGGVILPVFDLRAILGLPLVSLPEHGRMVIMGESSDELGLAVDAVEGGFDLDERELAAPPTSLSASLRDVARGVLPSGLLVLSAELLLASKLLVVDTPLPR